MKNSSILLLVLLTGLVPGAWGQIPGPDQFLNLVLENNKAIQTARITYQASVLKASTGNTPPDPEMELGYLFGKPADLGNRIDFSVTQQVEFPTSYLHRSRLKGIRAEQAELEFIRTKQMVLLKAKKLWIERIHLNKLEKLMENRLRQAEQIHEYFSQKLASGEVAELAYSQAELQLSSLRDECEGVRSDLRNNGMLISEITGGMYVEISDTLFPVPVMIIPDSLIAAYGESPEYLLFQHELRLKQQEKNLVVSQRLPRLSTGYYSESVLDQQFRGFQVGLSLPLWENSNRIRHVKSEIIAAENEAGRFAFQNRQELLQELDRLESLKTRSENLEQALDDGRSIRLLASALQSGEISLSEYFYASDFYFRNSVKLLQYQKETLLIEAELLKIYL